jgi:hypothetical protein
MTQPNTSFDVLTLTTSLTAVIHFFASELLHRLAQVINLARIGRNEAIQGIEFLGIAQLFGKHDLADLLCNVTIIRFRSNP